MVPPRVADMKVSSFVWSIVVKEISDFDRVAERLEAETSLNRLEARGTLRIALKDSGFDAKSVSSGQLCVVIEKLLPGHLQDRGIADSESVCRRLTACLSADASVEAADSPEAIFSRLGSS
jgi:hypothetical protein